MHLSAFTSDLDRSPALRRAIHDEAAKYGTVRESVHDGVTTFTAIRGSRSIRTRKAELMARRAA